MGLRCTVLGHTWRDPETEREREETESEVVTSVRTFRECERCGGREVLGENVEVTAREPDDGATDEEPGEDPTEYGATDAGGAAAVIEDAETGERTPVGGTDDGELTHDDGVILDDSERDPDRDYGEWPEPEPPDPEADDVDPGPWPEHDADALDPEEALGVDAGGGDLDGPSAPSVVDERAESDTEASAAEGHNLEGATAVPVEEPGESTGDDESGPPVSDDGDAASPVEGAAGGSPANGDESISPAEGEETDVEILDAGTESTGDVAGGDADSQTDASSAPPTAPDGSDGEEEPAVESGPARGPADAGDGQPAEGGAVDPSEMLSAAVEGGSGPPVEPTIEADVDVDVFCPNCGYVHEGPTPSLRGGDSCPGCRMAYLVEREE